MGHAAKWFVATDIGNRIRVVNTRMKFSSAPKADLVPLDVFSIGIGGANKTDATEAVEYITVDVK